MNRNIIYLFAALVLSMSLTSLWWLSQAPRRTQNSVPVIDREQHIPAVATQDPQSHEPSEPVAPMQMTRAAKESPFNHPAPTPPVEPLPAEDAPPSMRGVVDTRGNLASRLDVLDAFTSRLAEEEYRALATMLLDGYGNHELDQVQKLVLHNDILTRLLKESGRDTCYRDLVAAIFNNKLRDVFERDYALQHLGRWYEQIEYDEETEQVLFEAAREYNSSIAGTALLALHRHRETYPEADRQPLAKAALAIAESSSRRTSQNTALRVCALLGLDQIIPKAVELALDAQAPIPLRATAISVIGDLGGLEEESVLTALREQNERRLKAAVKTALKKFTQRLKQAI